MKKLLITTDCFLPRWDGIARFVTNLLPGLKDHFEISIACPAFDGPEPSIPGVKIIRFPLVRLRFGDIYFTKWRVKEFKHLLKEYDLVFNQSLGPIGMSAILAAKELKKPVVSFMHSIDWELVSKSIKHFRTLSWFGMKILAKWFYNKCTLLIVPSEELAALLTMQGIKTKKLVVELHSARQQSRSKTQTQHPSDNTRYYVRWPTRARKKH
jgi:glycosyltransferase involved in cell wall biosynthesis